MMRWNRPVGILACLALVGACSDDDESGTGGGQTVTPTGSGGTSQGGASQGGTGAAPGGGGQSQGGHSEGGHTLGGGGTGAGAGGDGGQGAAAQACDEPNPDGAEIVNLINAYRQSHGLSAIPYSPSLSCVAVTHVHDLSDNQPHQSASCNLHSWSDQGSWTACCYTSDHAQAQCMWDKPSQITIYSGYGYENAASGASTPQQAVSMWQNSSGHNDVILNQSIWSNMTWNALGAGMVNGYATLWFGEQVDPAN